MPVGPPRPKRWPCDRRSCWRALMALDNKTVAEQVRCSANTVAKWRKRFIEHRLDGLLDEDRPGRPRTISVDQVEDVIVATLESTPPNATHWTRSKMAARTGLSKTTIGKIWKDFGLKPHKVDHFKLSTDPLFIDKLYDVVGLYLNPPEAAVVLCVDEKSQVQALQRSQPAFPMMPGMPERRTHDYVRHGTTTLFAAMNVADGTVITSLHRKHRAVEFKKFLTKIDDQVPDELDDPPDLRQLRHPQAPDHQDLARRAPPGPPALHPDLLVLAQPGGAVLRLCHRRPAPTLRPPQRPSPRSRHPQLGQGLERQPQAIRLDQDRRTDPRLPRTTYPTDLKSRTLGGWSTGLLRARNSRWRRAGRLVRVSARVPSGPSRPPVGTLAARGANWLPRDVPGLRLDRRDRQWGRRCGPLGSREVAVLRLDRRGRRAVRKRMVWVRWPWAGWRGTDTGGRRDAALGAAWLGGPGRSLVSRGAGGGVGGRWVLGGGDGRAPAAAVGWGGG